MRLRNRSQRRTLLLALAIACACNGDRVPVVADTTVAGDSVGATAQLIDSTIAPAIAGEDGWNYHLSSQVDLTGDGRAEQVVLTARVEMYRGRPAWDDGQPWQVYVESPDGSRTYIYAQRLQLGTLTMRLAAPGDGRLPSIVLLEHLPHSLGVYEAAYDSTGRLATVVRFERELDATGQIAAPILP